MSTSSEESLNLESKFTRGEKCIFTHLVVTFCIILILIIIYFIHLCFVSHSHKDVWKISHRKSSEGDLIEIDNLGLVYLSELPQIYVCNSLLLRERWSVAPGHCVAMRTDPDMSQLLLSWRVKYRDGNKFVGSDVKRTIPHPHFDRDDFRNNIGLIEHGVINGIQKHVFPNNFELNDETLGAFSTKLFVVGWSQNSTCHQGNQKPPNLQSHEVKPVSTAKCTRFMSPILDLRPYEFCVIFDRMAGLYPEHGSVFTVNSKILGFFTWGERTGQGAPGIILNLKYFQEWLENIIAWK